MAASDQDTGGRPKALDLTRAELPFVRERSPLHGLQSWIVRHAAGGLLPLRGLWPPMTVTPEAREGRLGIELVSHCWNYSHLLECQLGSLLAHPPREVDVTMTVYFSREDQRTARLLELAGAREVPGVTWSWRALPKELLFRRSIGRNHAALSTSADWIWFTDCDVLFGEGCLDGLGRALQGRTEPLVFPAVERLTSLLEDEDLRGASEPALRLPGKDLEFVEVPVTKAKGPLQITHGDVARGMGYCRDMAVYQRPEPAFAKCREDTAFRWLLGTHGVPVDVPAVSRLRHLSKGRYTGTASGSVLRRTVRQVQERFRHPG
jgi:hypothetical protein